MPDRRELWTLRYQATGGSRGTERRDWLVAEGSAPAERVSRVIAGVLRRGGTGREPLEVPIHRDAARWAALLLRLRTEQSGDS